MAKKILVFDSGIGGLSIAVKVLEQLPAIELDYAFDNQAFPYGDKDKTWLLRRILQFLKKAVALSQPDLLIVACNTATTLALNALREEFSLPIVGVVPAIKPATLMTKSKEIILMATPNTIVSQYTKNLIDQFAQGVKVHLLANKHLVNEAEKLLRNEKLNINLLEDVAKQINSYTQADTIVLACTHYPFLRDLFIQILPNKNHQWIDSSTAIVKQSARLLNLELNEKSIERQANFALSGNQVFAEKSINLTNSSASGFLHLSQDAKNQAQGIFTSAKITSGALTQNLTKLGFVDFTLLNV